MDEILELIESVSEGFPSYFFKFWSCQKIFDALIYLLDKILLDLVLSYIDNL